MAPAKLATKVTPNPIANATRKVENLDGGTWMRRRSDTMSFERTSILGRATLRVEPESGIPCALPPKDQPMRAMHREERRTANLIMAQLTSKQSTASKTD